MPTLAIKTIGGKQAGEVTASERVFAARVNIPLMHQAVKAEMENRRQDTRNAPGRGAAHGPHPRDLGHALPKKMKRLAIWSALTAKLNDAELVVVDSFPMEKISTKAAGTFLKEVTGGARKSLVIIEGEDETVIKSLRNIEGITLRVAPAFSTRDVVNGGIIVATKAAIRKIDSVWAGEVTENA